MVEHWHGSWMNPKIPLALVHIWASQKCERLSYWSEHEIQPRFTIEHNDLPGFIFV
jgi:hypothetical protein